MKNKKLIMRPAIITTGILLIPFLGNIFVDGWNWSWRAFVVFGIILFGAGLAYELTEKGTKKGIISGFIVGEIIAGSILGLIKHINPNDDIAGIIIITFLIFGIFFACGAYGIKKYKDRMKYKKSPQG